MFITTYYSLNKEFNEYFRSFFYNHIIDWFRVILLFVYEFKLREGLHYDWVDYFHGVFSKSLACANSFAGKERYKAHRVVFSFLGESFWLKLFVVGTPLVLKVMQFFYVLKHHVTCSNFELSNI